MQRRRSSIALSNKATRRQFEAALQRAVREALLDSNPTEYRQLEYVEFLCLPAFESQYLLQLFWNKDQVRWVRNTWNRAADQELLQLWLDVKLEGGATGKLQLTIDKETGIAAFQQASEVLGMLHALRLPIAPRFNPEPWGRDGEEIILRLGADSSAVTFHWFTMHPPQRWSELNQLAEALMQLNARLK